MSGTELSAAQLLALEQKQLHHFLTDVRPVGEEKSELYPEPQYFTTAFMSVAAQLPGLIDTVTAKSGGVEAYAHGLRKVLSTATALHMSGLAFIGTWGREMWLLEDPQADPETGIIAPGAPTLSNDDAAKVLRFSHDVVCNYRQDGAAYPHPEAALGPDYRILAKDDAAAIAEKTEKVSTDQADDVLGLLAGVRAISFLMEAETREALMMHGPYPVDGGQLVLFECQDLHWSLFPNFPLPDGARWALPDEPFPYANLAIAMVVRDTEISSDRFGTIYLEPFGSENIVRAGLLTRGTDAYADEGLSEIPVSEAGSLRRLCDDIQDFMFLQVASWDKRQRMAAGVFQEHMLLLRILNSTGAYDRAQIEAEQQRVFDVSAPIVDKYFDSCLQRGAEELPFFTKIEAFATGESPELFTPIS